MRVDTVDIEQFAKDEYPGITLEETDGENVLIGGENRSGKTLTFNALLYDLLGSRHTIGLNTGRSNSVFLKFTDGSSFLRDSHQAEFSDGETEYESGDAKEEFAEWLCDEPTEEVSREDIIKCHFLHSHLDQLPLTTLGDEQRISLIRGVVDESTQVDIETHERAQEYLDSLVKSHKSDLERLEDDEEELRNELNSAKNEYEKYENLLELLDSGRLEELAQQLQEHEEVRKRLSDLYTEKENLRQTKRSKKKLRRKWKRYREKERQSVIASATNDFVCPVCEGRVSEDLAENRMNRSRCPFCAVDHDLDELKESIEEKIDQSEGEVETLNEEIERITERIGEIDKAIQELQEERPEVSDLDSFVERQLRQNDYQTTGLREEAEEELAKNEETIEKCEPRLAEIEAQENELEERIPAFEESLSVAEDTISELEEESRFEDIETFRERWEEYYQQMAGDIGLDIRILEEGDIIIPGNETERHYDQAGDLSDSEVRLLNISFAVTLNHYLRQKEHTEWNTVVMDEPFTNLDDNGTQELVEFTQGADIQFIMTTSDEGLEEHYVVTGELTRQDIQTTLNRFL
jgi:DNA repair exonuclease SbcCD ATPase subunit